MKWDAHEVLFLRLLLLAGILCALPSGARAQQEDFASLIRPQHKTIVQRWLKRQKGLRMATEADVTDKEGLERQRKTVGKTYHPFYAVEDFNGDKQEDFAVMLVTSRGRFQRTNAFAVAVFNGPFRAGGNIAPSLLEEGLDPGDWLFYRPGSGLMVGPPQSDNCFIFQPRGKTYVIKECIS